MKNLNCEFCNDLRKNENSLRNHQRLCKLNPNKQISSLVKYNEIAWNKGLNKFTNSSLMKASNTLRDNFKSGKLIPSFLYLSL